MEIIDLMKYMREVETFFTSDRKNICSSIFQFDPPLQSDGPKTATDANDGCSMSKIFSMGSYL